MIRRPEQLTDLWQQYVADPCGFVAAFWPHITLAPYQVEVLRSVVENTETWVHSANQMGKSFTAALAALWWFASRKAQVIVSSSTEKQLKVVLWGEIDNLIRTAAPGGPPGRPNPFGFQQTDLRLFLPNYRGGPEQKYYLIGQVTSNVESFQGHHLPALDDGTGTVLFVLEEASYLPEEFYEAAASQAHRILAIGNPLRAEGIFYDRCRMGDAPRTDGRPGLFRKVLHVSGEDSPNVRAGKQREEIGKTTPHVVIPGILTYEEWKERKANWSPHTVRTRLEGRFEDESGAKLFTSDMLDAAVELGRRYAALLKTNPWYGGPFALGVDCAEGGGDNSVWVVLGRFGVVEMIVRPKPNTRENVGVTLGLIRKYKLDPSAVAFDAAIGRPAAEELQEKGHDVIDVRFGAKALRETEFPNRRCEMYGELSEAMSLDDRKQDLWRLLAGWKDGDESTWRSDLAWRNYWAGPDAVDPFELRPPSESEAKEMEKLAELEARYHCIGIPACGELRQELAVLPIRRDGEGRLRLPPKDRDASTRSGRNVQSVKSMLGGRSPDRADALVLAYFAWQSQAEERAMDAPY